jgi:excisionase family DNA binding protein
MTPSELLRLLEIVNKATSEQQDQGSECKKNDRKFTIKTALTDYFQGTLGETKLREAIRRGEIPHIRVGARIILRESALDAWMEEQECKSVTRARPLRVAR